MINVTTRNTIVLLKAVAQLCQFDDNFSPITHFYWVCSMDKYASVNFFAMDLKSTGFPFEKAASPAIACRAFLM